MTKHNDKFKYRDSVEKWTTMLRLMEQTDAESQARLSSVALIAPTTILKRPLINQKWGWTLTLEGAADDEDLSEFVASILNIITTKPPTKKIRR